jgi:hypothetical protein
MSVIKLQLTETHVKLLKHLRWSINDKNFIIATENEKEDPAPFGDNNVYDAIDLILNGKPAVFNPLETEELVQHSTEQKAEWDKLYAELPLALEIILFNGSFELGTFRCRFHDRQWEKLN